MITPAPQTLGTERLLLRRWRQNDRAPFADINADPEVMEFFPTTRTRAESDAFVDRIEATFIERQLGLWAVEVATGGDGHESDVGRFVGYVGLWPAAFEAHFTPAIEIGWRAARWSWGRGYAPEAAHTVLADGFGRLGLTEIVSFTTEGNARSRRVMEKLGLHRDPDDDFDHPLLAPDHALRRHVLYRIDRDAWSAVDTKTPTR